MQVTSFPFVSQISIGQITIQIWGLFVALGIICGTVFAAYRAKTGGLKRSVVVDLIFWVVVTSVIGAKVAFLIFNGKNGVLGFSSIGAILAGSATVFIVSRIKKISTSRLMDVFGPPLLLVEGVGRIGCFMLHEHLGKVTDSILGLNILGESRHDLGLYFSLAGFAGLLFVLIFEKMGKKRAGAIGAISILWYFGWRFALEFLLESSGPFAVTKIYGLTFMQIFSAIMSVVTSFFFLSRVLRKVRVSGAHSGC